MLSLLNSITLDGYKIHRDKTTPHLYKFDITPINQTIQLTGEDAIKLIPHNLKFLDAVDQLPFYN